jgi:hypothetical protein
MNLSVTQVQPRKSTGSSLYDSDPRSDHPRSGGRKSKLMAVTVLLSLVLANVGCQHIGPPTVTRDRLAYNEAIASSWKQQILLDIVRLHYADMADFVDIGTVQQGHTLMGTTSATLGASLLPWNVVGNTLTPSLMGTRATTDNPSITYTPQSGSDFTRNLNAPLKPSELFNLIEGGYRADYLMTMALTSINGIRNDPNEPKFKEVTKAFADARYVQGDVSFPIEINDKKVFMIIPEQDSKPCQDPRCRFKYPVATIREVLHLRAAVTKFEIVPGRLPNKEDEIAVETRSVIAAMIWLSRYVPVMSASTSKDPEPPLKVFSDSKKPGDKYAAIKYRGAWFWIDWDDDRSNRSMVYLRTMLALADTGARPIAPVLTLPVSR